MSIWLEFCLKIALILFGFLFGFIPALVKYLKARSAKLSAKSEAENAKAEVEMQKQAIICIQAAEKAYEDVDKVLKQKNSSAGAVKKRNVLVELQAFAIENGYSYNAEYWSEFIDDIVSLTKSVNKK